MYIYLKERQFYQDIYDRHTVEDGRRSNASFEEFFDNFFKDFPDEDPKRPGVILQMNLFYMASVGNDLLDRYDKREEYISDWMATDQAKDERIANARLSVEPICQHCNKTGLRIIDKSLMRHGEALKYDDTEEVLFMLECSHCKKTSAYWEDGSEWERRKTYCPRCNAVMTGKSSTQGKVITTKYSCLSCGHSHKDKIDLKSEKEFKDPELEKDKKFYCLQDKKVRDELRNMRWRMEEMARLGKEFKEREDNKDIYDAMAELKRPKITELSALLKPILEKAGYTEFTLDKPEVGKDVFVGFSCLDSISDRDDNESRKILKKIIEKALVDTNWRLMSDGISYRLGYLSGRLRAFEREEDLKELVMKSGEFKSRLTNTKKDVNKNAYTIKGKHGETIIL